MEGAGNLFLLRDTGQTSLLEARVLLGTHQIDAAEAAFTVGAGAGGVSYPAGSWIVQAPLEAVEDVARRTGLSFAAAADLPDVRRHQLDLPRLALYHTWIDTQDAGWARYTLDRGKIPYTLINDGDLRQGNLAGRFDVILFPNTRAGFGDLVHGIDPKYGPLAYTKTPEFPSHGIPDASEDITGGMGFEGLMSLQKFLQGGGVLITSGGAGALAVDGGLVRGVFRVPPGGFNTPGSELRAKIVRPEHPITYGYEELTSVFRGNGPIYDVPKLARSRVVVQFGTKKPEGAEEDKKKDEGIEEEDLDTPSPDEMAPEGTAAEEKAPEGNGKAKEDKEAKGPLVLSGFVRGEGEVDGKPAILDVPVGKGRVILFAFNPLHRYLNLSDFRFAFNAILNWNDLPASGE